jgi:ATP/maltotriose-dependent transcriptional regulator MalT
MCLQALDFAEKMGNHFIRLPVLCTLAELELRRGEVEAAIDLVEPAVRDCRPLSAYFSLPIYIVAARAFYRAGRGAEALRWLQEARNRGAEFAERYTNAPQYRELLRLESEMGEAGIHA